MSLEPLRDWGVEASSAPSWMVDPYQGLHQGRGSYRSIRVLSEVRQCGAVGLHNTSTRTFQLHAPPPMASQERISRAPVSEPLTQ